MQKWQRNYEAIFEICHKNENGYVLDNKITVSYPFTLNLHVSSSLAGSSNEARLQFYNLSPDIRKDLWKDNFNTEKIVFITLRAGYGSEMPVIFYGWVQYCVSYKEGGSTEWKTELQAFEGGYITSYGFLNSTYIAGTTYIDILNDIAVTAPRTQLGYVSKNLGSLNSDKTFIGQTLDLLQREFEGYDIFISKGLLNVLDGNETLPAELPLLTDESGLLGSPKRSGYFTEVDMLFEPQLDLAQIVSLKSELSPEFNQTYKIVQIIHSGIISAVTSGDLTTSITLSLPYGDTTNEFQVLSKAEPIKFTGQASTVWAKPVKGVITSGFGYRVRPIKGATTNHNGIDIGAALGTPVYAPADGVVIMSKWTGGYGNTVQIDHGEINGVKVTSFYGHLVTRSVKPGQRVYKGSSLLGAVGSTGVSTGPHLHFTIYENGQAVNPIKYIGHY